MTQDDSCAAGSSLWEVGISPLSNLILTTGSDGLSTNTTSFLLKTAVFRKRLTLSYLYRLCAAVNRLSAFFPMSNNLAERRVRTMRGDTLPDSSDGIVYGRFNVLAPGGWRRNTRRNGSTKMDWFIWVSYAYFSGRWNIFQLCWCTAT